MNEISRDKNGRQILRWGGNIYELSDSLNDAFHRGRASILLEVLESFIANSVCCSACEGTGSLSLPRISNELRAALPELEITCIDCTICDGRGRVPNA